MADGKRRPLLWDDDELPRGDDFEPLGDGRWIPWNLPAFSTQIADAWVALEFMRGYTSGNYSLSVAVEWEWFSSMPPRGPRGGEWTTGVREHDYDEGWNWSRGRSATADTAPLAICRAMLLITSRA